MLTWPRPRRGRDCFGLVLLQGGDGNGFQYPFQFLFALGNLGECLVNAAPYFVGELEAVLPQVVRYVLRGGVVQVPHVAAVVLGVGWVAPDSRHGVADALGWQSLLWPRQVLQDVQPLLVGDLHAAQDVPSLARLVEGVQRLVERISGQQVLDVSSGLDAMLFQQVKGGCTFPHHAVRADQTQRTQHETHTAASVERVGDHQAEAQFLTHGWQLDHFVFEVVNSGQTFAALAHANLAACRRQVASGKSLFGAVNQGGVLDKAVALGDRSENLAVILADVGDHIGRPTAETLGHRHTLLHHVEVPALAGVHVFDD